MRSMATRIRKHFPDGFLEIKFSRNNLKKKTELLYEGMEIMYNFDS
jgi:hypothetical protein